MNTELTAFISVVEALQNGVQDFFPETSLGEQLGTLSLVETRSNAGGKKDVGVWFDTCFEQIYKTSRTLALTLDEGRTQADTDPQ